MYCAACVEETEGAPCARCGADPLLDGRYRLQKPLGRGAQGTTWAATRLADGELVAIKAVPLPPGLPAKERELASREVEILRQLRHPAVPALFDSFTVRGGAGVRVQYLVQQFVPGHTLADELRERRFGEDDVLGVLEAVLPVLDHLHGLSPPVVHRDLKPRNVMRRPDGALVLIDFGSVKSALSDPQLGGSTVAGTFGYMAPEQLTGDAVAQSDLYALGATAVALLSRQEPRELLADGRLVWRDRVNASPETVALLEALLAPEPKDRPASARVVLEQVRALRQRRKASQSAGVSPPEVVADWRWPAGLVGATVTLLAATLLLARRAEPPPPPPPRCGDAPCSPVDGFSIRGLALGQRYDEAIARFPELLDARPEPTQLVQADLIFEPHAAEYAQRLPGSAYRLRTPLATVPADCVFAFAVRETLSRVHCTLSGTLPEAQTVALVLEDRHGPPDHERSPGSESWSWSDPTGRLRLSLQSYGLVLEVQTVEHGLLVSETHRRAQEAKQAGELERAAEEQRQREAVRQRAGSLGGL